MFIIRVSLFLLAFIYTTLIDNSNCVPIIFQQAAKNNGVEISSCCCWYQQCLTLAWMGEAFSSSVICSCNLIKNSSTFSRWIGKETKQWTASWLPTKQMCPLSQCPLRQLEETETLQRAMERQNQPNPSTGGSPPTKTSSHRLVLN